MNYAAGRHLRVAARPCVQVGFLPERRCSPAVGATICSLATSKFAMADTHELCLTQWVDTTYYVKQSSAAIPHIRDTLTLAARG